MTRQFIKAITLGAMVTFSITTIASAESVLQKENFGLTPTQNLHCESSQLNYLAKPLVKQIKVSTRCVEEQSTENLPQQSKICSVYYFNITDLRQQDKTVIDNRVQVSRSSCFTPKPSQD